MYAKSHNGMFVHAWDDAGVVVSVQNVCGLLHASMLFQYLACKVCGMSDCILLLQPLLHARLVYLTLP